MNIPAIHNFPETYRGDGIRSFSITIQNDNGDPIDLSGSVVRMALVNGLGLIGFEFSTEGEGESLLIANDQGIIQFPEIKSWNIDARTYQYDLEVTGPDGFVTTYLKGTFTIINDVTK